MVLAQSFWVGLFGIAVAMPVIFTLGSAANFAGRAAADMAIRGRQRPDDGNGAAVWPGATLAAFG